MYFKEDTSNLNIIIIQEFFNIPSLNRNNYPTYKPDNIYQLINQHFLKSSRKLKKKTYFYSILLAFNFNKDSL